MRDNYCMRCGSRLKDQPGFDPAEDVWKCKNCGLKIKDRYSLTVRRKQRRPWWIIALVLLVVILCVAGGSYRRYQNSYYFHRDQIQLTTSAAQLCREDYREALQDLRSQGFTNIVLTPEYDMRRPKQRKNYTVKEVLVGEEDRVRSGTWLDADQKIELVYHAYDKPERDGFSNQKNDTAEIAGVEISVPKYYDRTALNEDSVIYTAEDKDERIARLELRAEVSDFGQQEFLDRQELILTKVLGQYENSYLLRSYDVKISGKVGYFVEYLGSDSRGDYTIRTVVFLNPEETSLVYVSALQSDDSKYSYWDDFEKIVEWTE